MTCPHCQGSGWRRRKGEKSPGHVCSMCIGRGEVPDPVLEPVNDRPPIEAVLPLIDKVLARTPPVKF